MTALDTLPTEVWVPRNLSESSQRTDDEKRTRAERRLLGLERSLREAGLTFQDLMLGIDTVGWQRLGTTFGDQLDVPQPDRRATVLRSRWFWDNSPLPDRITTMWTEWCFGRGLQIQAADAAFQEVIDSVLNAKDNRKQFSKMGWKRSSNTLLTDGERWFAFWPDIATGTVRVRNFDSLEITEVLTNPDDKDEVWYYKRQWYDLDKKVHTRFYRDWNFVDSGGNPRNDNHPRMKAQAGDTGDVKYQAESGVFVSYLAINTLGLRGRPLLRSSFDWIRSHSAFMKDRSGIQAARHQFAWKVTAANANKDELTRLATGFDAPDPFRYGEDVNTPRAAAFFQNKNLDVNQMPMQNDGASAQEDARAFRAMAALPGGVPDFLLGDTGNANLATARAVERPLEVMFGSYQSDWSEFIVEMCEHIGEWQGWKGDPSVEVDTPSVYARDAAKTMTALAQLGGVLPQIFVPQVVSMLLTDLGVEDVDDAMAILEPLLTGEPSDNQPPPTIEAIREAMRQARAAVESEQ